MDIPQLKSVPDKNYLVTLELNGKQVRLNVKVEGNKAKVINSSDQALVGAEGRFQPHPHQPGVFAVTFHAPRGAMTQIWFSSFRIVAGREDDEQEVGTGI